MNKPTKFFKNRYRTTNVTFLERFKTNKVLKLPKNYGNIYLEIT